MDNTKIVIEAFDKYADAYQEKYMSLDIYHDSFNLFCDSLSNDNASILDIACGPGNISQFLLKQNPNFNLLGIDLSQKMIALAKINNPTANFRIMDCRNFHQLDQSFDGIICGFALPYISKIEASKLIRDANSQLNSEGLFYLSTMVDELGEAKPEGPSTGEGPEILMHYYESNFLENEMKGAGFQILSLEHQVIPDKAEKHIRDLILIGKK